VWEGERVQHDIMIVMVAFTMMMMMMMMMMMSVLETEECITSPNDFH
jgi:hypothetical protein